MIEERNGNWETGPLEAPLGRGLNLQIEVLDLEGLAARLRAARIALFRELHEVTYTVGDRHVVQQQLLVQDPDGYLLRFCTRR